MDKSSEHLTVYLDRIHSFLISSEDSLVFPTLTMYEDILVYIAEDTNFLKQSRFGEDCKNLVAKLTAVLDKNKDIFTLGHEFKFDDKRKKVMVYKKIPVHAFQEAVSVPSKPLRKPNFIKEKTEGNTPTVMSSFKITFLNATLKFVKNDAQMVLSYPNMSSEQAVFVKQMIDQCMERNGTKAGFKGLYDPLAEALKIFSLKYDFNLYVGTLGDMKKVRFEKTKKITDTNKREGTRIIYEETTDSDSSLKQIGQSKNQKKLTTLIDVMTHITAEFKLRALTELKDFLSDKNTNIHTFSNLKLQEQQFISHWQTLAQRIELMKFLDVQGKMVLDMIRGFLKKKNFKVKVELGMSLSQDRFAKLTKVFSPNNVKLTEEQKIARLQAMVLPTQTRRALALAENSSSNSSSDTNARPQNKFDRKVAKFFRKTKGVKNDWIQATLTRLRDFLQDEAEATLIIRSITELQIAFLAKWQNLLSEAEVINTYPTDVQMLMHEVRDVATANKKKFRVEFNLTKYKTGLRDARFAKLPAFYTQPNQILKENIPVNILPKNKDNKTENDSDSSINVNKTSKKNAQPKNKENKTENSSDSSTNVKKTSKKNAQPKNKENKTANSSDSASNVNKISKKNIQPKNKENKTANSSDSASNVNKISKKNVPINIPPKSKENKSENGIASIKNESANKQTTTAVKLDPKKGDKSDISLGKVVVPINKKLAAKFELNADGNKGAQKVLVPIATNLAAAVKIEPKKGGNKVDNSSEKIAASKTTKIPPLENYEAKEISKNVETAAAALKTKTLTAPVKFEPKQSDDKAGKNPANATKARLPGPIHKSISLISLNQKGKSAKNARKVVRLPAATVKLIEALNQPLVSERGLKMMRQMGWQGGPLGLRGEGIAEPLMPELDLAKRAGFGAPKANLQVLMAASKSADDDVMREGIVNSVDDSFKQDIIQTLLRMVKGDSSQKTEIKFNRVLTMPDWEYVKIVATHFNNREVLPEGMLAVLTRVTDDELMLAAAWSCAKTEILLILSKYNEDLKINREQWSPVSLPKETLCKRNKRKLVEVSTARDVVRRVMVTGEVFKHYVMAQILDFCLNCNAQSPLIKEVTKDIVLKGTLVKKQRSYVRDVVTRVNSSARCASDSVQEVAIHDEIVSAIHGKGYRITVDFPSLEGISGERVYNIISFTKTYGYRAKTVLVKLPPPKTEATTTKSSTKESHNKQAYADIIEKNVQELKKCEPIHVTKTKQHPDIENKESNIQNKLNEVQTANIIEDKVKSPVVSEINSKPNNKKVDETISNDIKINSQSETENILKNKETVKECFKNFAMIKIGKDNNQKKEVDGEKVSAEYIKNTDWLKGTEKNGHDLTTIDDEKIETNKNDKASRLIKSIENLATTKVDITNDKSSKTESEPTALAIQIKTDSNESDNTLLLDSIDNITSKICNVTITDEYSKTTEKPVGLCQIHKEFHRSEVEEKTPPINDIIASLELNITENTKSEKVINDSRDVPTVSYIEVNRESYKKDQTLKRLNKRIRSKAVSSDRAHKRTKYDYVKHINIKPKNYPQSKLTNNMAAEIQKSIRQSIDYTQVLPLLKCHGIQDGVLSYSCHNEKSLEIIQNVLKKFDLDVKMTEESEKGSCKMSLRLNTFIDESAESIFNNLETFNLGLSTKDWVFIKKEQYTDFLVIFVDMDLDSYKFIRGENFKLYAGIDEAQFSIVWG